MCIRDRLTTSSASPYATASAAVNTLSRSMSARSAATSRPVCRASTSSTWERIRTISLACRARSDTVPCRPPLAGCPSSTRACSRTNRRPGSPPASSTAAVEAACPTQNVEIGACTYVIVS